MFEEDAMDKFHVSGDVYTKSSCNLVKTPPLNLLSSGQTYGPLVGPRCRLVNGIPKSAPTLDNLRNDVLYLHIYMYFNMYTYIYIYICICIFIYLHTFTCVVEFIHPGAQQLRVYGAAAKAVLAAEHFHLAAGPWPGKRLRATACHKKTRVA